MNKTELIAKAKLRLRKMSADTLDLSLIHI